MPKSPFTTIAGRTPEEYGLIASILAAPADDLPKLVYADWLDECSDPRGSFLRSLMTWRTKGGKLPKTAKGITKGWRGLMGYEFDQALTMLEKMPAWAPAIRGAAKPSLNVTTKRTKANAILIGASKVGGTPDLPAGSAWPMNKKSPMAFFGQWNLEELAVSPVVTPLPRTGLLSFFVDLQPYIDDLYDSPPPGRVIYTADTSDLKPFKFPKELPAECRLKPCSVSITERLTIPGIDSKAVRAAGLKKESVQEEYGEFVSEQYSDVLNSGVPAFHPHQILGHHHAIQEDPLNYKKGDWVLLSEFGYDPNPDLLVGDGGVFYFFIRTDHLAQAKFDAVEMELQMG
jgi:uncharacterized protein (TIGR02996 family)